MPTFDDRAWRTVDLPHDWSAEGPFSAANPSGNGYAPGGIAWYRKHFTIAPTWAGKIPTLEFDGVYDHSEVWINGHLVCSRAYGYSSFECPLAPYARIGSGENVIAVRVDHSREADSRWYTGSGIYRHVRLRLTNPIHIAPWGTFVTTPQVTTDSAVVHVETTIENATNQPHALALESMVMLGGDTAGDATTSITVPAGGRQVFSQDLTVARPKRWQLDSPTLYSLHQFVRSDSVDVVDQLETDFGIRSIRFDAAQGFFLNEQPLKIKGVCVHHDAGSLGAAVPTAVWERRLRALKAIGVNAIRTSHNPPAPEFLDLADRLGFLVKDEAFDEFTPAKNKWVAGWNAGVPSRLGYAEDFRDWAVTDVSDMVRRDRNHPSVVAWSIGNEVDYPNDPFSHQALGRSYRPDNPPAENLVTLGRPLVDAIKALDRTRPVTAALASVAMSDAVGFADLFDIVGYNYQESRYAADHAQHPARVMFGSENNHQYANWAIVRDNPYVAGQFLWTGIDYLGEAGAFPNRANGAGLLDLCGFKKPAAWFRQSLWSDAPMVYAAASLVSPAGTPAAGPRRAAPLQEHWNWPAGSTVSVSVYTNADDVSLSLNGRAIGTRARADAVEGVLQWEVPFEPGILRASARAKGQPVAEFALTTAGAPVRVELVPDSTRVFADELGVLHLEYRVVDGNGVRVPTANPEVTFEVQGPVRVLGIGTGDLSDTTSPTNLTHRAYQGHGLAILQSTGAAGPITVRATSPGLAPATVSITAISRPRG